MNNRDFIYITVHAQTNAAGKTALHFVLQEAEPAFTGKTP